MNRYDVASVAKFNPLSFQEILLAPSMMRKNHDATIALAQSSVLKPDPLDVHYNRAMELKNQMDSEIAKNVEELNKEGFNSASYQNVQKLNRQYQDLISPTGEVGQINNAKKVYAENYKEFLDDATKNKGWSRERAIDNWQNRFANKYTGFGEDGKSITNIGQYGAPKKIEVLDKLKDVHSLLGEQVVGEMRASGYSFAPSPDGGMVMVDRSGRRIETSNKPNLNNALALLQNQFVDKEWKDSMQFEGANPLNVASQITNGVNAMLKTGVVDNRSENAQYIAPKEGKDDESKNGVLPSSVYDPSSTREVGKEIKDIDFSQIGTNQKPVILPKEATAEQIENAYKNQGGRYTYKNVLNPLQQKLYEVSYKRLLKNGRIPKGADMNDPKVASKIGFYMNNHLKIPTVGNDIIRADVKLNDSSFMGELKGQSPEDRNQTLTQDVRGNENNPGFRQMIDSETGKKVQLYEGEKIDYIGFDSPVNYRNYNFGNKYENSVMAHKAQVLDKNGNFVRNVTISRTPQEMKKAIFRRSYEVNQVYKTALENLGEWVQPTGKYSGSNNLKTIQVRYTDNGKFQLKSGKNISKEMEASEYFNEMDMIMEDVGDKN